MSERATCATKGCGAEIQWSEFGWFHQRAVMHVKYHPAHPAGGTNTTPPEELERDLSERVNMDKVLDVAGWPVTRGDEWNQWNQQRSRVRDLIQSYADQAVEEATAEGTKWRDEYNAQKKVMADLRDQLDRATGETVAKIVKALEAEPEHGWMLAEGYVEHGFANVKEEIMLKRRVIEIVRSLAPLETECEHHPVRDLSAPGTYGSYEMYPFCPKCGESLTKGGA